eukprot:5232671-Prymnesium_polylepis.1
MPGLRAPRQALTRANGLAAEALRGDLGRPLLCCRPRRCRWRDRGVGGTRAQRGFSPRCKGLAAAGCSARKHTGRAARLQLVPKLRRHRWPHP